MLPILLPARAVGSIFSGYGYGFRFSGSWGAARVRQAGRFTRHSFRVNLPCQPATSTVLRRPSLLHPFRPRPFAFSPAPCKIRPCPSRCRRLNAEDVRPSATNGNHRQQSTTRRHCLCYRLIDTAAVALRRRSAPLRSAVCSLRSRRVGRALVAILSRCLGFGVLSP